MKATYSSKFTTILTVLTLCFAGAVHADSIPATLVIGWGNTTSIKVYKTTTTTTTTQYGTAEFQIDITSDALGMNNYKSYGYCVELGQSFQNGKNTYGYSLKHLIDFTDNTDKYYKAAWVMDQFAPGRPDSWTPTLQNQAAAVQGLIWELTGQISSVANSTSSAIYGLYSNYKTQVNTINWNTSSTLKSYLNANYMFASNATNQDLLVKVDPVPEPATLLLFGSGMLGLAGLRFRRKSKAN